MADNARNPRNQDSTLFKQLTRLFSGPITNYRVQTRRRIKRRHLDKYGRRFKSMSGQEFQKAAYNPFEMLQGEYMMNQRRAERYKDFDQMEYMPEIASGLDIYADEMTTHSDLQPMLRIDCPNEEIKSVLEVLYKNILNLEFNLFGWSRTMCKYGDFMLYLDIDEEEGIKNAIGMPPSEIERLEGEDPSNPNYVQYQMNSAGITFENWQIAHFRILGNDKYAPYGTSVLEPARRIWRQLQLLEDAMMAYRIVRSPERRVFYIDVGNIAAQDVEAYMQKIITHMKRHQVVDENTGRVDLRYNPLSVDEDYFLPVRGEKTATKIETLPGGTYTGDIDDVKYLRDKLFSALKIPASYLSRAEGAEEDKTTLAQKDIRFARTIQRLQRAIVSEIEKIGIIHLYVLGFRGEDLVKFKVKLQNPSKIAELQELEHWQTKFNVADQATAGYFSKRWIYKHVFSISDDEAVRLQREQFFDAKSAAMLEAVAEVEAAVGLGAAGLGADLEGGDEFGDLEPLEGEEGEEAAPGEEGGEEEDGTLLAAPAHRRDKTTTTVRSKGKRYLPAAHRGGDRRKKGARVRSNKAKYAREVASSTERNTFKGMADLRGLAAGIAENAENVENVEERYEELLAEQETIYKENLAKRNDEREERLLLEVNQETKNLIAGLEGHDGFEKDKA